MCNGTTELEPNVEDARILEELVAAMGDGLSRPTRN